MGGQSLFSNGDDDGANMRNDSAGTGTDSGAIGADGFTNAERTGKASTAAGSAPGSAARGAAGQADVGGVESLGMVADEERLTAEADAAVDGVPPDISGAIEQQLGAQLSQVTSWTQITGDGIDILSVTLLPQWHLTDAERERCSAKLARMLDLLVPITMSPKVEAVIGCLLTFGAIGASRVMMHGKLPPLGPPKAPREPTPKPAEAARESAPLRPENLTSLGV